MTTDRTQNISDMLGVGTHSPPLLLVTRIPATDTNSDDGALAAVIGGIVVAALLALICIIAVCLWWLSRRKGSYVTNEMDEDGDYMDNDDNDDESFLADVALECKVPLRAAEDES